MRQLHIHHVWTALSSTQFKRSCRPHASTLGHSCHSVWRRPTSTLSTLWCRLGHARADPGGVPVRLARHGPSPPIPDSQSLAPSRRCGAGSDMRALIQEACQGAVRDVVAGHAARLASLSEADLRPVNLRDFQARAHALTALERLWSHAGSDLEKDLHGFDRSASQTARQCTSMSTAMPKQHSLSPTCWDAMRCVAYTHPRPDVSLCKRRWRRARSAHPWRRPRSCGTRSTTVGTAHAMWRLAGMRAPWMRTTGDRAGCGLSCAGHWWGPHSSHQAPADASLTADLVPA